MSQTTGQSRAVEISHIIFYTAIPGVILLVFSLVMAYLAIVGKESPKAMEIAVTTLIGYFVGQKVA
jgi:uncharacterized membrane protein YkvA (DUF1232 family)